ncbi:hypothetical protein D3C86_1763420 [compost metagenome]
MQEWRKKFVGLGRQRGVVAQPPGVLSDGPGCGLKSGIGYLVVGRSGEGRPHEGGDEQAQVLNRVIDALFTGANHPGVHGFQEGVIAKMAFLHRMPVCALPRHHAI